MMEGPRGYRLRIAQDMDAHRLLGADPAHEELHSRMENLPTRKELEDRLWNLRSMKHIGKRAFDEAVFLAQSLALYDVWEVLNSHMAGDLLKAMEWSTAKAEQVFKNGGENAR